MEPDLDPIVVLKNVNFRLMPVNLVRPDDFKVVAKKVKIDKNKKTCTLKIPNRNLCTGYIYSAIINSLPHHATATLSDDRLLPPPSLPHLTVFDSIRLTVSNAAITLTNAKFDSFSINIDSLNYKLKFKYEEYVHHV